MQRMQGLPCQCPRAGKQAVHLCLIKIVWKCTFANANMEQISTILHPHQLWRVRLCLQRMQGSVLDLESVVSSSGRLNWTVLIITFVCFVFANNAATNNYKGSEWVRGRAMRARASERASERERERERERNSESDLELRE